MPLLLIRGVREAAVARFDSRTHSEITVFLGFRTARLESRVCAAEVQWEITQRRRTYRVKRRHMHVRQATPNASPLVATAEPHEQGCDCLVDAYLGREAELR